MDEALHLDQSIHISLLITRRACRDCCRAPSELWADALGHRESPFFPDALGLGGGPVIQAMGSWFNGLLTGAVQLEERPSSSGAALESTNIKSEALLAQGGKKQLGLGNKWSNIRVQERLPRREVFIQIHTGRNSFWHHANESIKEAFLHENVASCLLYRVAKLQKNIN